MDAREYTCKRVLYTISYRAHVRIPNGHPREEHRASDKSARILMRARLVVNEVIPVAS